MLSLIDRVALSNALNDHDLAPDLRALIDLRAWQFYVECDRPPGQDVRLFVVQGGDTPDVINGAVGFRLTGAEPEDPGFEWIEGHGGWFEIAYTASDGVPVRIFVEDDPSTELGIHYLCLLQFWPDCGMPSL